jgi:hypothetical protein
MTFRTRQRTRAGPSLFREEAAWFLSFSLANASRR